MISVLITNSYLNTTSTTFKKQTSADMHLSKSRTLQVQNSQYILGWFSGKILIPDVTLSKHRNDNN